MEDLKKATLIAQATVDAMPDVRTTIQGRRIVVSYLRD